MASTNQQIINDIETNVSILYDKITKGIREYENYLECSKEEWCDENSNETEEEAIKRAEGIYDRLDEMIKRNESLNNKALETIELLKKMTDLFNWIVKNMDDEKKKLGIRNDELIDIIIDLERRKTNKLIEKNLKRKYEIKGKFKDKKGEWNELRINKKQIIEPISKPSLNNLDNTMNEKTVEFKKEKAKERKTSEFEELRKEIEEIKRKQERQPEEIVMRIHEGIERKRKEEEIRVQEERMKRINNVIDNNEIQQIEEWTKMKIGNIIFDSNFDNWEKDTSVFDQRIIDKRNLIFLIEDEDGNKFGGYVNAKIDKYRLFINDSKSFVFSLKSNGRLNGMMKFDIKEPNEAFFLFNQSDYNYLFAIGGGCDIFINKENNKSGNCRQKTFNYNGIENAFCGKGYFTLKRMTVVNLTCL